MNLRTALRYAATIGIAACVTDQGLQAFDEDDNDDTLVGDGKADGTAGSGYRSGCGAPICGSVSGRRTRSIWSSWDRDAAP